MVESGQKVTVVPLWLREMGLPPPVSRRACPVGELHPVVLAVAVDLDDEALRQGIDDRHADPVQTA